MNRKKFLLKRLLFSALVVSLSGCYNLRYNDVQRQEIGIREGAGYVGQASDPSLANQSYQNCYSKGFGMDADASNNHRGFYTHDGQYCPGNQIRSGSRNFGYVTGGGY